VPPGSTPPASSRATPRISACCVPQIAVAASSSLRPGSKRIRASSRTLRLRAVSLDDKYDLSRDHVFVTGTQAVIRMLLMQGDLAGAHEVLVEAADRRAAIARDEAGGVEPGGTVAGPLHQQIHEGRTNRPRRAARRNARMGSRSDAPALRAVSLEPIGEPR
jgi:hypothetical protein